MHAMIDDFAWIAIGLVVVAFLFTLGAAYILADEGLKILFRKLRRATTGQLTRIPAQTINRTSESRTPLKTSGHMTPVVARPNPTTITAVWHALQHQVEQTKPRAYLRLHIGQHKPANAKP